MNRITTCTKGMLLACTALAFAFAGCTSDQASTGGIDAALTLDADAVVKHITTVTVTIDCTGIDPITGLPWPSETFDVNVNTSEGNDPTDPKDSLGVFKKEGLPAGLCTVTIVAISDDGTMTCAGQLVDIPVIAQAANTFVTIIINCITDARYGGIGVEGEFNQCSEYSQIIVSPTTQSTGGDAVDVQIWCYDPDGGIDNPLAAVLFITAASSVDPNPANWVNCGSNPAYQFPPTPVPCPHQDPPTVIGAESADLDLFCNIGDDPAPGDPGTQCVVIVSISDDGFAAGGTDPFGCDGTDDNANAVIPVFCQSLAVCGNSVIEPPEACDPPSTLTANPSGDWCDSVCQLFDPRANPSDPPANCSAPANPQCASIGCFESGGIITCTHLSAPPFAPCDFNATLDGFCNGSGSCEECLNQTNCPDTDCVTGTCNTGLCQYANNPVGSLCGTDGQCSSDTVSVCQNGDCTNAADSGFVCSPAGAAIKGTLTACGICEILSLGCPLWCDGTTSPAGGPAAVCGANILLLGGNGGACT
ncbi:MAG: hypothetical protein JRH14_08015, partial [Deltaproteobacteria bacterium]|nr:hypothetical protein [Deltaproteobacteria bacterium]